MKNTIDGQIAFDGNNLIEEEVMPVPQEKSLVVEENGSPVNYDEVKPLGSDDLEALELLKPGKFDIRNFHIDFKDNTKRVLLQLVAMQSNEHPLKKGGEGIAYRCDALILQNRQHFSDVENTLLDIFLGAISSAPDDKAYFICPKKVAEILNLENEKYAYKLMSGGVETIIKKPLIFEIPLESGKKKVISIPWFEAITYVRDEEVEDGEPVGIAFTPSDFFKMLTISSSISHGAHYSTRVAYSISGQYAKSLFHYLESMKNHCAYPNATPGWFKKTLDEIRNDILYCPKSYRWADMNRRAFKVVKDIVNSRNDVDFSFDYEKKGDNIMFMISKKGKAIESKEENSDKEMVKAILTGNGFTGKDADVILKHYINANRDIVFLTQALTKVMAGKNIKSKTAVLCSILDNGLEQIQAVRKHDFSSINRPDTDYDELEKLLLNSSIQ